MKSFDEWFNFEYGEHSGQSEMSKAKMSISYEAGAQSRQSEVDELKKRIDGATAYIEHWYGCVELSNIVDILNGDMKWNGETHES